MKCQQQYGTVGKPCNIEDSSGVGPSNPATPLGFFPYIRTRFTVMNVSNQTRGPKNGNETDFYYALR